MAKYEAWPAYLITETWSGRCKQRCEVIGETGKRYRIRSDVPITLPRNVILQPGYVHLAPKRSVIRREEP